MAALKKILTSLKRLFKFKKKASGRKGRKKISRRAGKKPSLKRKPSLPKSRKQAVPSKEIFSEGVRSDQVVGEITHFFPRIQVVVVKMLKGSMRMGDRVRIKGKTTDFTQPVRSMQIESVDVKVVRRSEEHTSELQSQFHLVFRLLLQK